MDTVGTDDAPVVDEGAASTDPGIGQISGETFSAALSAMEEARGAVAEPYNGSLWHYTSNAGADGILRTGRMWATDSNYLNDTTELLALAQHLFLAAGERSESAPTEPNRVLAGMCTDFLDRSPTTYVLSFSRLEDNLVQWRTYGDDGGGSALVLDSALVPSQFEVPGLGHPLIATVELCEYLAPDEIAALANRILDAAYAALESGLPDAVIRANLILYMAIATIGPTIKAPSYAYESEVRVVLTAQQRHTDFEDRRPMPGRGARLRGGFFVPYMGVPVADAISHFVMGPKRQGTDPEVSRAAYGVRALLDEVGRPKVEVRLSPQPYRR